MPVRGTADGCHLTWRRLPHHRRPARHRCRLCAHVCRKTDGIPPFNTAKAGEAADRLAEETGARAGRSAGYRGSGTCGRGREGAVRHDRCRGLQCRHRRTEAVPEYHRRGLDAHAGCQSHGYGAHDSRRLEMLHNHKGSIVTVNVHGGRVRRVLREPLFREQGCDHRS